ncbi:hypothetical protein K431DRAFT_288559 [Polychaeton citri CBS 116435]|uniref:Deoxyribonuclease NucA/NucB domain-containing protein n=1 Tax=Polychaeton citri CBS 116435 TaxID=1314669 RepID=A0A9P4ULK7_9PEZI|nr:hypothetical protein K431DRAFT_288559 [Polychaeton citri CBS 116435]
MTCAGAEDACQNACYYVNYVNTNFIATYSSSVDNDRERAQSGCQTQQGSICNLAPFSQRFHDSQEPVKNKGENPGDPTYDCDEFPMAGMAQDDFKDLPQGTIRNSLRCIRSSDNESGGGQFRAFIADNGDQPQRTCTGPLPDDATFKIGFDFTDADKTRLSACKDSNGDPLYATGPDSYNQFYMTILGSSGVQGSVHFPYQSANDNHYAIGSTDKDVLQCKIVVTRTSGDNYDGTVFDVDGNAQGTAAQPLTSDGDSLLIPGQGGLLDLRVFRLGQMGEAGTVGSEIEFNYGDKGIVDFQLGTDFWWTTLHQGWDLTLSDQNEDALPGGYCVVPNISEDENGDRQTITCYFPCNAA